MKITIFFLFPFFTVLPILAQQLRQPLIQCSPSSSYNQYSNNHTHGVILDFQTRLMETTLRQNGVSRIVSRMELLPEVYGDGKGFTVSSGFRALEHFEYEIVQLAVENGILPGFQYADKKFGQGYFVTARYQSSNGFPPPRGKNVRLIEMSRKQSLFCLRIER